MLPALSLAHTVISLNPCDHARLRKRQWHSRLHESLVINVTIIACKVDTKDVLVLFQPLSHNLNICHFQVVIRHVYVEKRLIGGEGIGPVLTKPSCEKISKTFRRRFGPLLKANCLLGLFLLFLASACFLFLLFLLLLLLRHLFLFLG